MTALSVPARLRWTLPEPVRAWASAYSFALRLLGVLAAITAAYSYSLLTLVRALNLDTPLAYLGLVPFMALGIGLLRARPEPGEPAIHDREIDYIVGVPFLAVALLIVTLLPDRLSSLFWVWRIDLLSLPFFVAGVVTLVFGVRTLWRLRLPIAFLALSWPLPYTAFLGRWLDGFTGVTVSALKSVLTVIPVGQPVPGSDGSLFAITHHSKAFVLSVASSCSGVNGVVGFLLIGVAFTCLVEGRRLTKAAWLAGGMALIWALNLGRLVLLFWAGQTYGESFAVDGLHPVVGLLLLVFGVLAMIAVMKPLRLSIPLATAKRAAPAVPYHRIAVPRVGVGFALVLTLTTFMGVANAGMRHYQLVAGDLGSARLTSFAATPAAVPDFGVTKVATYPWSRRFFGADSSWSRYTYAGLSGATSRYVTADVVSTSSLSRLSDYGIKACYQFHGYDVSGEQSFRLGGGVTGNLLTYTSAKQHLRWSVVYWIWPVKSDKGQRFERVALLVPSTLSNVTAAGPEPRTDPVQGLSTGSYIRPASSTTLAARDLDSARAFVTTFAKTLVSERSSATRS